MNTWNESGRVWEEDHGLLDAEQVAQCERADVAEPLRLPIPTRMISNGEYMPVPQTEQQQRVEARIELAPQEVARHIAHHRRAAEVGERRARGDGELHTVDRLVAGQVHVRRGRTAQGPVRFRRPTPLCPREQALSSRSASRRARSNFGSDCEVESLQSAGAVRRAGSGVERLESGARRSSHRSRLRPHHTIHQRRFSRQPSHDWIAEQRHRFARPDRGRGIQGAAKRGRGAAR